MKKIHLSWIEEMYLFIMSFILLTLFNQWINHK